MIVVGGGIIGCAIARELAARGAAVRVFEARTVGGGATHASAGILAPYIEGHDRGPLFDLTLRSLAMYDDFVVLQPRVARARAEHVRIVVEHYDFHAGLSRGICRGSASLVRRTCANGM